jgi:hypothetical protein
MLRKAATTAITLGVCGPKNSKNKKSRKNFEILFLNFSAEIVFIRFFVFVFEFAHTGGGVAAFSKFGQIWRHQPTAVGRPTPR